LKTIKLCDQTMKYISEKAEDSLSFREKIELAKILDRLCIDVIETESINNEKTDTLLIKSIGSAVNFSTIAVPVNPKSPESVDISWQALCNAKKPRLQVPVCVSTVQMEYFYGKKAPEVLEIIKNIVTDCKSKCNEVEFIAEDSCRSEKEFLFKAINVAIEAGAGIITVCDTAGTMMPDEIFELISEIKANIPDDVILGISSSDAIYMADANAIAALRAGASEVKICARDKHITAISGIVSILKARGASFDYSYNLRSTELSKNLEIIKRMWVKRKDISSPYDTGVRSNNSEISLTLKDEMDTVIKAAVAMGYELDEEDSVRVYEAFKTIAGKKEVVGQRELDAIVASAALQVPSTYILENYMVTSGNLITATSHIKLKKGDKFLEGVCIGDGPIDASFLAIEQITGIHYELDDFQIQAVTEGHEAMGETIVKLRNNGRLYSGRGISTDIVGSSIKAYINALNKIVYEEA